MALPIRLTAKSQHVAAKPVSRLIQLKMICGKNKLSKFLCLPPEGGVRRVTVLPELLEAGRVGAAHRLNHVPRQPHRGRRNRLRVLFKQEGNSLGGQRHLSIYGLVQCSASY